MCSDLLIHLQSVFLKMVSKTYRGISMRLFTVKEVTVFRVATPSNEMKRFVECNFLGTY